MQWFRFYLLGIASLLVGLTMTLSACQKGGSSRANDPTGAPTDTGAPKAGDGGGGGGIDGSGGDSVQSSLQEVQKAFAEEIKLLPSRLQRMSGERLMLEEFAYDHSFGSGAKKLVLDFLKLKDYSSQLAQALEEQKIRIQSQNATCETKDGNHAGSAKGNLEQGEICISYEKLRAITPIVLNQEIFGLLIHELSHLSGFDEAKAVKLQKLLMYNRNIYSSPYEPGFINGLKTCDVKLIQQQNEEMKKSAYWVEQLKAFSDLMADSQPRGCGSMSNKITSRIDIFADDAEFLAVTGKFPDHGYQYQIAENPQGESKALMSYSDVQDLSQVASVYLRNRTGIISIPAKMGTDAQCSPKILLANLIANVSDVLLLGCGGHSREVNTPERIRARIQKEKDILAAEPKNETSSASQEHSK